MDFRFTLSHTPKLPVTSLIDLPDNSLGTNAGPAEDGGLPNIQEWIVGSVPSVNLPGEGIIAATQTSRIYAIDFTFSTGLDYAINYSVNYDIGTDTSDRTVEFVVLDGADNVLVSDVKSVGSGSGTLSSSSTFTAPSGAVKYGFRVEITNTAPNVGGSDFEIENNLTGTVTSQAEPGVPTSLQITEPDGWKGCKIVLERHDDFHSLIEHYEGGAGGAFIFYGNNGQKNGGIDFLRGIEQIYGFDAQIDILTEFSFDSINYEEIFTGQVDVSAKDEMVDNLMQAPIIRDDLWTKFITRRDTQVDLSSNVSLDGNIVAPLIPVTVNLPTQKIRKVFDAVFKEPNLFGITTAGGFIQFYPDEISVEEIEEFQGLYTAWNPAVPVDLLAVTEGNAGSYTFDLRIIISGHFPVDTSIGDVRDSFRQTSSAWKLFFKKNDETAIEFNVSNIDFPSPPSAGAGWSIYTFSSSIDLIVGDQIRIYGDEQSNIFTAMTIWTEQGAAYDPLNGPAAVYANPTGYENPSYFLITADTVYPETTAQGYLIHDILYGIIQRICGRELYSEFLGASYTNMRQYDDDGCGAPYAIIKGLQLRQYSLTDKPFFTSFNQMWNGIHPILCLGLSYEDMDDSPSSKVIRIEQMDHFFNDEVSINFSNVRDIHSYYDQTRVFKVIKTGYKKWETEVARSIDDPQTKRSYALRFGRVGKELNLESDFIAGGLTIENTRRTTIKKSADYKYDNDNFIITINPDDVSPDRYNPELDENFDSITGIINSDTRYNLILTPMRNLLRWAKFIGGCMQSYATSAYRFVSGEGNYDMLTDYSCASGNQCQAVICDPLSERQDISLADYNSVFGYLHLAQECEMVIPMTKYQYDVINNNRNKSIGISQTDSNFTKFKIKLLKYDLIQGQATIKAWPKTYFNIQVIDDPIEMPDCSAPPPCCSYDCFDSDYKAILDYAVLQGFTLPSDAQQCIQNQFIVDLKAAEIWFNLDLLYVFATDGSEDFAKINWINPGTFTPVENGTVTFTTNAGFQGNGTNGYFNTGYTPSTSAVNYLVNNACAFCYINNEVAGTTFDFGVNSGVLDPSLFLIARDASNRHSYRINSPSQQVAGTGVSSIGFFQVQKRANESKFFKNGSQVGSDVPFVATGLPNRFLPLFANNNNGSIGTYSTRQMGVFGLGSAFEGNESALYAAWNDYFTSL